MTLLKRILVILLISATLFSIGCGGYLVVAIAASDTPEASTTESPNANVHTDYWEEYGGKIKDAYTSKFGGANTEFNREIDANISIMQHNGRGITRTLAKERLNRYSKFTESK